MDDLSQSGKTTGTPRCVVVGAGIGGLVAALSLAIEGLDVTLVDAADGPGGKLRPQSLGGLWLDAGPTVFTMRWVFDALAQRLGKRLDDELPLRPLQTLARHHWRDGRSLDLFANLEASADAIGRFAGADEARRFCAFSARARRMYDTLWPSFMQASRPNPVSLAWRVAQRHPAGLARISPFGSMWGALGAHFTDPHLRQLFGRYATYCGSSPLLAPATLMLIAHVEQAGVWSIDGGMHRLATVLARWFEAQGGVQRYGDGVVAINRQGGAVHSVRLASGHTLPADCVVFNGDVSALGSGLLGPDVRSAVDRVVPSERSLSAITWNVVIPRQASDWRRHTVCFSDDSESEFRQLFAQRQLPRQPTVYVCAHDRDGVAPADPHRERLLCLVNAPADADRSDGADEAAYARVESAMKEQLDRCGWSIPWSQAQVQRRTPHDFERSFPGSGGALYGRSSHGWRSSFVRAAARSAIPGLYLAGGGVHPGPGVPMAALSGQLAARSVCEDLGLHRRRSRA